MKAEIFCPHCESKRTVTLPVPKGVRTCRRCGEIYKVPAIPVPKVKSATLPRAVNVKSEKFSIDYKKLLNNAWRIIALIGKYAFLVVRAPFVLVLVVVMECWYHIDLFFAPTGTNSLPQETPDIPQPAPKRSRRGSRREEEAVSDEELAEWNVRLAAMEARDRQAQAARDRRPTETFAQARRRLLGYDETQFQRSQTRAMYAAGGALQRNEMISRMDDIGDDISELFD